MAVGLAIGVCTGCAPAGGLDVAAMESDLVSTLLPDTPGAVSAVECPDPLDPAPGDQVLCTASIGRQSAEIELTFGAERGAVSAVILSRLVGATEIERLVATRFVEDLGLTTTVACGQPIMVVDPEGTVRCTAVDPRGVERGLLITVGADGLLDVALE